MTKFLIGALIVVGLAMGGYQIFKYWGHFKDTDEAQTQTYTPPAPGDNLEGMPPNLEPTFDASRQQGLSGFKAFLAEYGKSVSDPRLASIQLDYAVLLAVKDPAQAKKIYDQVKGRVQQDSPVYSRIQQLAKTYD